MRFDLFGFNLSRKVYPQGVIGPRFLNFYVNLFHIQVKRKVDPLNPMKRGNWSLLMIAHHERMWHIEVLFLVFRNDQKKEYQRQFMERITKNRGKKFSDRVKSTIGRW